MNPQLHRQIDETVKEINSHFDSELNCLQYEIIPEQLKKKFIELINDKGDNPYVHNLHTVKPILNIQYRHWLQRVFFDNTVKSYTTDISKRTQDIDGTIMTRWHRDFCNPSKKHLVNLPLQLYITSDTHIVLYYPFIENCKEHCGTSLKFYGKNGETIIKTLPADDNVVYCWRDCCFAHSSPNAVPLDITQPINRILVRSIITASGEDWQGSLCPEFVCEWGHGGKHKKNKRSKNIKTRKNDSKNKKFKTKANKSKTKYVKSIY